MKSLHGSEERLLELLATRAVEGLSPGETGELRRLLAEHPGVDADQFDEAAAWVALACLPQEEALPEALQARVLADFEKGFAATPARGAQGQGSPRPVSATVIRPAFWRQPAPAWLAAAASVLLALGLWLRGPDVVELEVERIVEVAPPAPAAESLRANLLRATDGLVVSEWQVTDGHPSLDVHGDVVWSPDRQEGYMRFAGLPANDPAQAQYQLWIFDATRDESFPVDGGVFDAPVGATEVVVPIRANIPVRQATLFAVTRERSGGVMVSSREELLLIAAVN